MRDRTSLLIIPFVLQLAVSVRVYEWQQNSTYYSNSVRLCSRMMQRIVVRTMSVTTADALAAPVQALLVSTKYCFCMLQARQG